MSWGQEKEPLLWRLLEGCLLNILLLVAVVVVLVGSLADGCGGGR